MIRTYENKKIYSNFKIVKILSLISIVLSVITITVYTISKYARDPSAGLGENQRLFYLFALITPLNPFLNSLRASKPAKVSIGNFPVAGETKLNNDFANTLTAAIVSFTEIILLIFFTLIGLIFGTTSYALTLAYFVGYMLISHILVYIAAVFLIYNCVLIKREWQANPPAFVQEKLMAVEAERKRNAEIRQQEELNQKEENYRKLIDKCGVKFFIAYYSQIKHLPLRDVTVTENYPYSEKEERLMAAKSIIDLNLTDLAITQILKEYRDFLSETEIEKVEAILAELHK